MKNAVIESKICSKCQEEKPLDEFWNDNGKPDGKYAYCKNCARLYNQGRDWLDIKLRQAYGITREQFDEMYRRQSGRCAICNRKSTSLGVDHDHSTGRVRALLCRKCNFMLGWYERIKTLIDKFDAYLEETR